MSVWAVYRRQPLIREVCRRVDYQGRYAWLVVTDRVAITAHVNNGNSWLRFRLIDLSTNPPRLRPLTRKQVKLDLTTIVVALPTLRNRRRILLIFIHPELEAMYQWSCTSNNRLSPEESAILTGDSGAFDACTMRVARAVCLYRGLIESSGVLTAEGRSLLRTKGAKRPLA